MKVNSEIKQSLSEKETRVLKCGIVWYRMDLCDKFGIKCNILYNAESSLDVFKLSYSFSFFLATSSDLRCGCRGIVTQCYGSSVISCFFQGIPVDSEKVLLYQTHNYPSVLLLSLTHFTHCVIALLIKHLNVMWYMIKYFHLSQPNMQRQLQTTRMLISQIIEVLC